MKKEARKHSVEKMQFEKMKAVWEKQVDTVSKDLDNTLEFVKWTVLART